ncbi:unnamed protein product [Vitrella brassicaformis CCMP3155]|uniref:Uncharacterized protein n=1 Tax=Vitrella brassicaformis (strain CCMP3155) TaxID=1169540 RepID=A0A0G4EBI9_VITBC|nr:unnamed protein product [Vitrella brassicaformis CCMP3155]|eukprot:CEL92649.1 unnamed protein product [Vitrella brassicaformis CCMP3155]
MTPYYLNSTAMESSDTMSHAPNFTHGFPQGYGSYEGQQKLQPRSRRVRPACSNHTNHPLAEPIPTHGHERIARKSFHPGCVKETGRVGGRVSAGSNDSTQMPPSRQDSDRSVDGGVDVHQYQGEVGVGMGRGVMGWGAAVCTYQPHVVLYRPEALRIIMPATPATARHVSGFSTQQQQQHDCCDLCAAVYDVVDGIGECVVSAVEGAIDRLKWFFTFE